MPTKKTAAKRYPPIPKWAEAPGGPVEVRLVDKLIHDGQECWGLYEPDVRRITVVKTSRAHQWRVYYHEWAHAALTDAGLDNAISDQIHEALCDALATARMRERFG